MKNDKSKLIYLPFLFLAPLLMANSPAPFPQQDEYESIEVNYSLIENLSDGSYRYDVEISNYGDYYCVLNNIESNHEYDKRLHNFGGQIFENEMIAPHYIKNYSAIVNSKLDSDLSNEHWTSYCYANKDENVIFDNVSIKQKSENEYKLSATIKNKGDYYYFAIVDASYYGERVSFYVSMNGDMTFATYEELNLNNFVINNVFAVRSSYNTYKGGKVFGSIFAIFGIFGIVGILSGGLVIAALITIGAVLLIALIVTAIVVPIVVVHNKKKGKKKKKL